MLTEDDDMMGRECSSESCTNYALDGYAYCETCRFERHAYTSAEEATKRQQES